ncbi:hypothetical protein [Azospirillum endophyticum]
MMADVIGGFKTPGGDGMPSPAVDIHPAAPSHCHEWLGLECALGTCDDFKNS